MDSKQAELAFRALANHLRNVPTKHFKHLISEEPWKLDAFSRFRTLTRDHHDRMGNNSTASRMARLFHDAWASKNTFKNYVKDGYIEDSVSIIDFETNDPGDKVSTQYYFHIERVNAHRKHDFVVEKLAVVTREGSGTICSTIFADKNTDSNQLTILKSKHQKCRNHEELLVFIACLLEAVKQLKHMDTVVRQLSTLKHELFK